MSPNRKISLEHTERCIGCYNCVFACSMELFNKISVNKTAVFIKPCSPADRFVVVFCTGCQSPPCIEACGERALKQDQDGIIKLVKPLKCEQCETFDCAKGCITGALLIDPETHMPILCTQCGKCAEACPHEVITFKGALTTCV